VNSCRMDANWAAIESVPLAGSSRRVSSFSCRGLVQRKAGAVLEMLMIVEIAVSQAMGPGEEAGGEWWHLFELTRTWRTVIDPSQTSDSMGRSRSWWRFASTAREAA
jgi:hypothetical protein